MHFNYQRRNEDGTPDDNWNKAIANTAFRQCFTHGLDLTAWLTRYNMINPLKCENDFYTMTGVCYNNDGKEYTELVREKMGWGTYDGETMVRLRGVTDFADLKKQAMDELSAIGVTFPVHAHYHIQSGSTSAQDNARRRLHRPGYRRVRLLRHAGGRQRSPAQLCGQRLGR